LGTEEHHVVFLQRRHVVADNSVSTARQHKNLFALGMKVTLA
jgi:hypothetical protein